MERSIPIPTLHLYPVLDELLIELLTSLSPEDWDKPTLARQWSVKDVAAHLLDTSMRFVSLADGFEKQPDKEIKSYNDLISYLNELNNTWVNVMKRVSPAQLIKLLEITNPRYADYYATLDPFSPAKYSVAWAGEETSLNWFHIARDYTEKWHHQQQIREAVGKTAPLMTRELFYPCMDTFMQALPYNFRDVNAQTGTVIHVAVKGEAGGDWFVVKQAEKWVLDKTVPDSRFDTSVSFNPDTAWKLFTKGITPDVALKDSVIKGDAALANGIFKMVSVLAVRE